MGKSFKIVLIAFAVYFVMAIQFYFEKGELIVPVILNPLILFLVSGIILIKSYKQDDFKINLTYFIGITIYALGSERSLNLFYNNTNNPFFLDIIQNPFLKLITILSFGIVLIIIVLKNAKQQKKQLISLLLLIISIILGLSVSDYELVYVLLFSAFVVLFYFLNNDENKVFLSVNYQLLLFALLENTFFIQHNYC